MDFSYTDGVLKYKGKKCGTAVVYEDGKVDVEIVVKTAKKAWDDAALTEQEVWDLVDYKVEVGLKKETDSTTEVETKTEEAKNVEEVEKSEVKPENEQLKKLKERAKEENLVLAKTEDGLYMLLKPQFEDYDGDDIIEASKPEELIGKSNIVEIIVG